MAASQPVCSEDRKSRGSSPRGDLFGGDDPSSGKRAGTGVRYGQVLQQFVLTPVKSALRAGRPTGRHGEIWS